MSVVIGLDYGTQSARGVLVEAATGRVLRVAAIRYAQEALPENLASADEYIRVLHRLLKQLTPDEYKDSLAGICVDATSLTLVPVTAGGKAVSQLAEYRDRFHAQIKLWKYHGAQKQAKSALELAQSLGEPFLGRTGGTISGEWMLPKLLEVRDEDPQVYAQIDRAMDLCEFLTFYLTGNPVRSVGSLSYKCAWADDIGFPSAAYLDGLRSGFSEEYRHLLRGKVLRAGDAAGSLRPELCRELGLSGNVTVAAGALDGHTAPAALGALQAGDAALVIGTSNVLAIQTQRLHEIEGICGIAKDGLTAGLYGIDSGQSGTGDMLDWFTKTAAAPCAAKQAQQEGIPLHEVLARAVDRPWENKITALDWWNGSRNMPCDLDLRGMLCGMSLDTKPHEIYLALLQAIVCGTREIIDACRQSGIAVNRVLASGGAAVKNPLLMQEYANILKTPVYVGEMEEGPALGAAVLAAVAAGIYPTAADAHRHMGVQSFVCYRPDRAHETEYENLFQRNHALRMLMKEFHS